MAWLSRFCGSDKMQTHISMLGIIGFNMKMVFAFTHTDLINTEDEIGMILSLESFQIEQIIPN